jgi:hypothetical protein
MRRPEASAASARDKSLWGSRALLLIALALAACNPTLVAYSGAPPGRTANLDPVKNFWGTKSYRMELTTGVAFAVVCYQTGPCEQLKARSDDAKIADVRPASLGVLAQTYDRARALAGFVVVGKTPGTTKIHVTNGKRSRLIDVTVQAAPVIAPATSIAN